MLSFIDRFEDLHSEAMKKVRSILSEQPDRTIDTFSDYEDGQGRSENLYVMFEASNYDTHSININLPVFALRLVKSDKDETDLLQILIPHNMFCDEQQPDFIDEYGRKYVWLLYPDHFYSSIFEIADYLTANTECNEEDDDE